MTSVVPKTPQIRSSLHPLPTPQQINAPNDQRSSQSPRPHDQHQKFFPTTTRLDPRQVSGHDFSRAENAPKRKGASAPARLLPRLLSSCSSDPVRDDVTLGSALPKMIHFLLAGAVFPAKYFVDA
jgi:hypothetical protein